MANELKVAITADNSSALASLSQFSGAVKSAASTATSSFDGVASSFKGLLAPITMVAGLVGGGALFSGSVGKAAELSKEVSQLQRLFGGTSEAASVTRLAIREVFGDTDTYSAAATKLVKTLNKNEDAVKSLGVATRDSKGHLRAMTELMPEVVQAIGQYAEGTDRDAAAQAIFGRSFADVLKYVNMTPAVMASARKHAEEFGLELDAQEKTTVKKYRTSVVTLGEAFDGFGVQVGLKAMPRLTALADVLIGAAPAAIQATTASLESLDHILSSTTVQLALGALALNSAIPLVTSLATKIPLVTTALEVWRFQMASAAMTGTTGLSAVAASAKGTGAALLGMINPWMAVAAVAVAAGYGIEEWRTANSRAAKAELEHAQTIQTQTGRYQQLADRLGELDRRMQSSKTSAEEKKKAQAEEKILIEQLVAIYPGFLDCLYKEDGSRRSILETMELAHKRKVQEAQDSLRNAEAKAIETKARIEEQRVLADQARQGMRGPGGAGVYQAANIGDREARLEDSEKALATQLQTIETARETLRQLLASDIEKPSGKHWEGLGDDKAKKEPITQAELDLRLQKAKVEALTEATLQEQQAKAEAKARLELEEQRQRLNKEAADGRITGDQARQEYAALKVINEQKIAAIKTEYNAKRVALEDQLQGQLTAAEEGGLAKRLDAIRKTFAKIREDNATLGKDGISEATLQRAQKALEAQAKIDQTKADLETLKKELSELSQINGGSISERQRNEVFTRYDKAGKGGAVTTYKAENHIGEGGMAGALAGVDEAVAKNENKWATWKSFSNSQINSVTSNVSNLFSTMLQHGQTGAQKWNALWMGISGSAIKALSDIGAQELVTWGVQKAKALWHSVNAKKEIAETGAVTTAKVTGSATTAAANTAEVASDSAATAGHTAKATSGFFAAYANIPWVGLALAMAGILAMQVVMSKITAHANGGVIDRPTLALMGEVPGSTEIVANERDFKSWAAQTSNAGINLGLNLAQHEAQVSELNRKASDYGRQALESGNGTYQGGYHDYRGALIVTTGSREWADAVNRGIQTYGRSRG